MKLKSTIIKENNDASTKDVKYCHACDKEFRFSSIKKNPILRFLWQDEKVEFYCSCCYLLKLIRYIKERKK